MADQTVNQTPASDLSEQSQIRLDKLLGLYTKECAKSL